jgi:hypothetical protein
LHGQRACAGDAAAVVQRGGVEAGRALAAQLARIADAAVACTASKPVAVRLPLFSSRPSAVTTACPTEAPMLPALRTPTPCSVEVR